MFSHLGDTLQTLCHKAERELLLVAPFIKFDALKRLLEGVDEQVRVMCVTRWRPDEIARGVSDIEIWQVFQACENATLWLRNDLHAKYYRSDENCLIGSANVTSSALGWISHPNYELLIQVPKDGLLAEFEQNLFTGCVEVDQDIFALTKIMADSLRATYIVPAAVFEDAPISLPETLVHFSPEAWIPTLRTPEKLFVAYQSRLDELTTAARETATSDLTTLDIPIGLEQLQFNQYVGTILLQFPIIKQVDEFVIEPRRFGAVRDLLKTLPCGYLPEFDANQAWQTLMRWLMYFLPERYKYSAPKHSEIFQRIL